MKGLDSLAPKVIGPTSREIKQLLNDGGQQVQKIAPQIISGGVEDVYKTPFRLLENSGNKKFA